MVQILGRKTKSSAVLLGEPGVGKSAVAEGVAAAITAGALPDGSPLPRSLVCASWVLVTSRPHIDAQRPYACQLHMFAYSSCLSSEAMPVKQCQCAPSPQVGRRVMMLDVALLVAGAKERGELEARVSGLLADATAAGDVILM